MIKVRLGTRLLSRGQKRHTYLYELCRTYLPGTQSVSAVQRDMVGCWTVRLAAGTTKISGTAILQRHNTVISARGEANLWGPEGPKEECMV